MRRRDAMHEEARPRLGRGLSRGDALFFDFDGTLAPIRDDPSAVFLSDRTAAALAAAAARAGAVMVLSGRDAEDLDRRVPRFLWRGARHGLLIAPPGAALAAAGAAPAPLAAAFAAIARAFPGARLEIKGEVLALHFRAVPADGPAIVGAAREAAAPWRSYVVQQGKCVVEAKPEAADKGKVVAELMGAPPFAGLHPVYIGDDATDEDAFAAVNRLGGLTVKVGEGASLARARLASPDSVTDWLDGVLA
jgi:trehalose 6-phosphate phosphatase